MASLCSALASGKAVATLGEWVTRSVFVPGVNSVTRRCKRSRLSRGRVPWFWHGSFARYVGLVRTNADRAAEFAEGLAHGGGSGTPDGLQLAFGRIVNRVRQVPRRDGSRGLCVPHQDDGPPCRNAFTRPGPERV